MYKKRYKLSLGADFAVLKMRQKYVSCVLKGETYQSEWHQLAYYILYAFRPVASKVMWASFLHC